MNIKRTLAAVLALLLVLVLLSGCKGYIEIKFDDSDDSYIGAGELSADGIYGIEIEWVSGNVLVETHSKNTVEFSESIGDGEDDDVKMRYKVVNGLLKITFAKSGHLSLNTKNKDLTVKVPKDMNLLNLEIETVSANVSVDGVNANEVEFETVSGNVNTKLKTDPHKADMKTVSGNFEIYLANPNFELRLNTITGGLKSDLTFTVNKNTYTCADGARKYSFDSVSGNIRIDKQK